MCLLGYLPQNNSAADVFDCNTSRWIIPRRISSNGTVMCYVACSVNFGSLNYKYHADLTRYINGYIPVMVQFSSCVKVVESFRGDVHFLYSHPVIHNDPWRPIHPHQGVHLHLWSQQSGSPRWTFGGEVPLFIGIFFSWFYWVQTDVAFVIPFLGQIFQFDLHV